MIIFRADGNKKIGSGHIMRCLSIADALHDKGLDSVFVTADDSVSGLLRERGYKNVVLNLDYRNLEEELELFFSLEALPHSEMVVVDSYYATDYYFKKLSEYKKIAYIDDLLLDRPVDTIINYNVFADAKAYNQERRLILGPSYAPLRKAFQSVKPIEIKEIVKKVLFLAGGSDPEHAALGFAKELLHHEDEVKYTIVAGSLSEDYDELKKISITSGNRISVLKNVSNMDKLMMDSDVAISASGSTLYELCACGVPTISYVLADNQVLAANCFEEKGAMVYGGDLREDGHAFVKLYSLLKDLMNNPEKRRELASKAGNIVDGKGAERLAGEILTIVQAGTKKKVPE